MSKKKSKIEKQVIPEKNLNEVVGERLRRLRQLSGLTIDQVVEVVGIARSMLSMIENGKRPVKLPYLHSFAKLYKVPVFDVLVSGTEVAEADFATQAFLQGDTIRLLGSDSHLGGSVDLALVLPILPGGEQIYRCTIPPQEELPRRDYWQMRHHLRCLPIEGTLLLEFPNDEFRCPPGKVFYMPAEQPFRFRNYSDQPISFIIITKAL